MMRIKYLLTVCSLGVFLFVIAGCESFDLGPGPTAVQGPKPPPKQQEVVYEKQPLTAPDEAASLGPTPLSARQTVQDENLDGSKSPGGGQKTTSHITFTGTVTALDTASRTISLKTSSKHLSFDLTNPVVRGYQNVSDIKVGDTVSLGYITGGIAIAKGETFPEDLKPQTAADNLYSKSNGKRSKQTANKRSAPVRVKYKVHRLAFADVDNNKDGKISPVELGCVLPSVTMETFKKYDRNGDGCLDANEYRSVRK
ncbi:MAG: hypothetical protein H6Q52_180 [Deltaproteobacteria bacterium]|nr:hypothetical protein [Deltaproteobacteria bacterium]